jgi:hypothetical protein
VSGIQLSKSVSKELKKALSKLNSEYLVKFETQVTGNLDLGSRLLERPVILRKEVIQPQVPLRLPCYDFTPITATTLVGCLLR